MHTPGDTTHHNKGISYYTFHCLPQRMIQAPLTVSHFYYYEYYDAAVALTLTEFCFGICD